MTEFSLVGDIFITTFKRKNVTQPVNAGGGLSGGLKSIYEFIAKNPSVRANQISESLDIPVRTVQRSLSRLKEEGLIEFKGSKKTGGYFAK